MATFDDLIIAAEVELKQAQKQQERSLATVKFIHEKARTQGRANLSMEEDVEIASAMDSHSRAVTDQEGAEHKLESLRDAHEKELAVDRKLAEQREGGHHPKDTAQKPAYDRVARVGAEERTYHRGNDPKGAGFIRDVAKRSCTATSRLRPACPAHAREERVERADYLERAAGTGAFAGLTVPQYLTDMYAPAVANLRPFANVCNHHDLPPNGMTINISRITTATGVALQATENTAVQNTDIDDTLLTENVQTAAGQQTLSRQAIDRATGVEDIVMDDLFRRYATTLDNTLDQPGHDRAGRGRGDADVHAGHADHTAGVRPVGAGTVVGRGRAARLRPAGHRPHGAAALVQHARRGRPELADDQYPVEWGAGAVHGRQREPALRGVGAWRVGQRPRGRGRQQRADQLRHGHQPGPHLRGGLRRMSPVGRPGAPVFIRAEQPAVASLGVLFVLYGYFAYTFRRFTNAAVKVDGTGLGPPAFSGS
jgi:hypothetical protein